MEIIYNTYINYNNIININNIYYKYFNYNNNVYSQKKNIIIYQFMNKNIWKNNIINEYKSKNKSTN